MRTFFITAPLVVAVDQAVKYIIKVNMEIFDSISVIKDIFSIIYIENSGVAFGIFGQGENPLKRWTLITVILIAVAAIFTYWLTTERKSILFNLSCGLIVGGAIGNLVDRILTGRVVDFVEVGYKTWKFAVFNIADSAVSAGVAVFILHMLLQKDDEQPAQQDQNAITGEE